MIQQARNLTQAQASTLGVTLVTPPLLYSYASTFGYWRILKRHAWLSTLRQRFKVGKGEVPLVSLKFDEVETIRQDFQRMRCGCTDALHARLEEERDVRRRVRALKG